MINSRREARISKKNPRKFRLRRDAKDAMQHAKTMEEKDLENSVIWNARVEFWKKKMA